MSRNLLLAICHFEKLQRAHEALRQMGETGAAFTGDGTMVRRYLAAWRNVP